MNKITVFLAVLALTAAALSTPSAVAGQYRIGTSNSSGDGSSGNVYVAVRAVAGSGDAAEANCRTAVEDLPGTPDTIGGCYEKQQNQFNYCREYSSFAYVCEYRVHEDGTTHRDKKDCDDRLGSCGAKCAGSRAICMSNPGGCTVGGNGPCMAYRPETYFDPSETQCQEPLDYIGNRPNNVEDGLRCFENPAAAPRSGANLPQAEFNNKCMVAVKRNGVNAPLFGGESLRGIGVGIEDNCVEAYQAAIANCDNCNRNNSSVIPLNDNGDLFLADGARECPPEGNTLNTDDFTCGCNTGAGGKIDHLGKCSLCAGYGAVNIPGAFAFICQCDTDNRWSGSDPGNCQLCPDDQVFDSNTNTCEGCHESAEMGDSGVCECADDRPKTSAEGEPTMCGDISCDNPNELLNSEGTKCVCMDEHNDYAEPGSCVADAVCEPNEVHINDNSDCVCADGFNDYANTGICEEDAKCEANQIFINDNSDCENCDGNETRNANNECFCELDNFDVFEGNCVDKCPTETPVRTDEGGCEIQTLDCPAANQIPNFGQTECICAPGHNDFVNSGSCVADANCRANQIFINDNSDCRNCPGNTTRNSENACVCNLDNFDVFEGNCVDKCESTETRNETTGNCEIVDDNVGDNEEENPDGGVGGDNEEENPGDGVGGDNEEENPGDGVGGNTGNNGGVGDNVVVFTVTVTVTVTVTALTEENVVDYGGQRYTVMAEAGADEAIAVINEQEGQETHLRVVARATPAPSGGGGGGSAAGIIGGVAVVALALWYFTSGSDDLAWTPSYSFANHNGNLSYSVGSRWTATANDWRLYWQTRKNGDRFVYGSGASYNGNILSAAMNSQSEGKQTDLDLALTINESFGLWNFGGGYHFDMQLSDEADEATETQNRLNARIRYTMDKWILSATANTDGNQTRGAVNYSYRF